MTQKTHSTALITGASQGIGRELAEVCAQNGHNLVLIARNEQALQETAQTLKEKYGITAHVVSQDLAKPQAADEIHKWLTQKQIPIDILINNAGFGVYGWFWETDEQKMLDMLQLNMTSIVHLTKLLLPAMQKQKQGYILNVGSLAGFQPTPLAPLYVATKAFLLSFSESLNNQLEGSGVGVSVLCPGPTRTQFFGEVDESKISGILGPMDPKLVAQIGYNGLMKKKTIIIPGLINTIAAIAPRFFPRAVVVKLVRWGQEHFS